MYIYICKPFPRKEIYFVEGLREMERFELLIGFPRKEIYFVEGLREMERLIGAFNCSLNLERKRPCFSTHIILKLMIVKVVE